MNGFLGDLRYALRTLRKSPGFTLAAILTLALGIGANTAIFTAVDAYMLRPLPFPDADRLAMVEFVRDVSRQTGRGTIYTDFAEWRQGTRTIEATAAFRYDSFNVSGGAPPERVPGVLTTASLFPMLGGRALAGRLFEASDEQPGAPPVALISQGLWERRFETSRAIIGQAIQLNGASVIVVGVIPGGKKWPDRECDIWLPLVEKPGQAGQDQRGVRVLARLSRGSGLAAARDEMSAMLQRAYSAGGTGKWEVRVSRFDDLLLRGPRPSLQVTFAAVLFVLMIACANVANLQLARATARQKEAAIRTALGATRGKVIRQALVESLVLALVGGALGVWLGYGGMRLLAASMPSYMLPVNQIELNATILMYALGITILTALLFGLAPALRYSGSNVNEMLKDGTRGSSEGARPRLGRLLVVSEIVPALILLMGAALLIKSLVHLQDTNPGFDPARVLTGSISLPDTKYPEPERRAAFFREVLARVQVLPGVESASAVTRLYRGNYFEIEIEGRAVAPGAPQYAGYRAATPAYFQTMAIPLLRGRVFTDQDVIGAAPVAVINQAMAHRFWGDADAVGKHLRVVRKTLAGGKEQEAGWLTVAGVVGDEKQNLLAEAAPEIYVPQWQEPAASMAIVVRTSGSGPPIAPEMRAIVLSLDRDQPISNLESLEKVLNTSIAPHRTTTMLLTLFGAIALFLSGVGIYGVISYSVSRRTQEVGIRMALGARQSDVLMLVIGEGMTMAAIGLVLGIAGAFAVTRFLSAFLYGVSATDALVFCGVPALFAAVAAAASLIPACRAARLDPIIALRNE